MIKISHQQSEKEEEARGNNWQGALQWASMFSKTFQMELGKGELFLNLIVFRGRY